MNFALERALPWIFAGLVALPAIAYAASGNSERPDPAVLTALRSPYLLSFGVVPIWLCCAVFRARAAFWPQTLLRSGSRFRALVRYLALELANVAIGLTVVVTCTVVVRWRWRGLEAGGEWIPVLVQVGVVGTFLMLCSMVIGAMVAVGAPHGSVLSGLAIFAATVLSVADLLPSWLLVTRLLDLNSFRGGSYFLLTVGEAVCAVSLLAFVWVADRSRRRTITSP